MLSRRWILPALLVVIAIASIYALSNPEMAGRYAQAQRDSQLSTDGKDIAMGLIALAIGGYLAWFFLIRKDQG